MSGGSRDGAVVRVLTSHQCGSGLIPRPGVMWAEFVLVLDPAPRVFLQGLRFSSLSKKRHAAYLSWLLAVLQGHAWTVKWLPAAPIHSFNQLNHSTGYPIALTS